MKRKNSLENQILPKKQKLNKKNESQDKNQEKSDNENSSQIIDINKFLNNNDNNYELNFVMEEVNEKNDSNDNEKNDNEKNHNEKKVEKIEKKNKNSTIYKTLGIKNDEDLLNKFRSLQKISLSRKKYSIIGTIMSPIKDYRKDRSTPNQFINYMKNSINNKELIVPHTIKSYQLKNIINGINEINNEKVWGSEWWMTQINKTKFWHKLFEIIIDEEDDINTWEDLKEKIKENWDSEALKQFKIESVYIEEKCTYSDVDYFKNDNNFEKIWKNIEDIWKNDLKN